MTPAASDSHLPAVIVGASTAGLHTAWLLAQSGRPVILCEASEELGPPARTLIITARLADALGFSPAEAIANRPSNLQLASPGRTVALRLREPDLIVEREKLVRLLAARAAAAGVEIRPGTRFVGLEPGPDGLHLHFERSDGSRLEPLRTHTLIGADGVASAVSRAALGNMPAAISLAQAIVALPAWAPATDTQVWFDPESTRYFYWLIPESPARAAVGLIDDDERRARESLDRFLVLQGLQALEYQEARVASYVHRGAAQRMLPGGRILLVGDAAAHVKMSTVGGAVTGFWGARAAARAVLRGTSYERELAALRWDLGLHLLVRRVLNRFTAADYDEMLALIDRRARGILTAHTRDEIGWLLVPALLAQPRLLPLAVRSLLRGAAAAQERGNAMGCPRLSWQSGSRGGHRAP